MSREFEIRKEVALDATQEQVWEAISTKAGVAAWFMEMEGEPADSGVTTWEPPAHLVIRTPEAPDGTTHAFEYVIEARDGGSTVLRFVHSGFFGGDWGAEYEGMTASGWDMYLHTLAEYLRHFPGRPAVYIEAEGPQASADENAWPVILEGLGLGDAAVVGDQVHLSPQGLAPVEGVVDYVDSSFLGVRTDHSLIRFHGRAALGMAAAVAEHEYAEDVDPKETAKAWESWLHRLFT